MRLQKYLARAGVASRRHAEVLIQTGKVKVNGHTVTTMGYQVQPGQDQVAVNGKIVHLTAGRTYILLYKPAGYVTTVADPQGRPKVTDLVKDVRARLYPVGRLDFATEGLLLLTDDGDLTLRLTHPRYGVTKTYLALVEDVPTSNTIKQLCQGVKLEDGFTAPARVRLLRVSGAKALLELTLREGRKREVRRMLAAVNHPVVWLKRTQMAFLNLKGLKPGAYRHLTPGEVERLYKCAGLK
jgi:pseudouridine synthase